MDEQQKALNHLRTEQDNALSDNERLLGQAAQQITSDTTGVLERELQAAKTQV